MGSKYFTLMVRQTPEGGEGMLIDVVLLAKICPVASSRHSIILLAETPDSSKRKLTAFCGVIALVTLSALQSNGLKIQKVLQQ